MSTPARRNRFTGPTSTTGGTSPWRSTSRTSSGFGQLRDDVGLARSKETELDAHAPLVIPAHDPRELRGTGALRKGKADHELGGERKRVARFDEHAALREILGAPDAGPGQPALPELDRHVDRRSFVTAIVDQGVLFRPNPSMVGLAAI